MEQPHPDLGDIAQPSSAGRARITGAIGVHRPGDDVAIAGPRGGKAWPRLFLGRRSLPSRYGVTPPFRGTLAGVLPYAAGALTSFNSAAAVDMDNMEVVVD
jgi:hypothetical protein